MANTVDSLTLFEYECTNESYTIDLGDDVPLTLMLIPAGELWISNDENESGDTQDKQRQKCIQLPQFLMGTTPVTQEQWRVVAGYEEQDGTVDLSPSAFESDDFPVESVSWYEAVEFCKRLSSKTGKNFHLPSETQWEYACRAETQTAYHFGQKITPKLANYLEDEMIGQTSAVESYSPNRWGLYDMHGNVWEWCQDYYGSDYLDVPSDGSPFWEGDRIDDSSVIRGGSWYSYPWDCRSACRSYNSPESRLSHIGFRVVCSAPRPLQ
ncbi:formylglycine-generating enzyme family protein [Acaryochloris marina]|uniref:Sulfatase-modifying factor enzyme-like domain-containing protein n=1 Tax=Acaryochloris marina (strain MBIC 11017) TaxID=329726 RepID=A8ZLG2_ACAM1|nr:formylglycine-generating enzyme family protein [Acaryochloris marina]ABW31989.1 conserved hypothetical protein [Acaryochloris marina MBIC11017]